VGLAAAGILGCSKSLPIQPTYQVTGQVTVDGKPVPGATLVFHAVDATNFKWQEMPQGRTDAEGKFTLTTYETGDGAPAAPTGSASPSCKMMTMTAAINASASAPPCRCPGHTPPMKPQASRPRSKAKTTALPAFALKSKP